MTGYGPKEMQHDLETLAAAGAYSSTPVKSILHAARTIAQGEQLPGVNSGDTSLNEEQTAKMLDLVSPLFEEFAAGAMKDALEWSIDRDYQQKSKRMEQVRSHYGFSREKWDAMTPWERSYYDQDFDYT